MKGWLFVGTTGGRVAARTCAKIHLDAVLAHIKLKVASVMLQCDRHGPGVVFMTVVTHGIEVVLYNAG